MEEVPVPKPGPGEVLVKVISFVQFKFVSSHISIMFW